MSAPTWEIFKDFTFEAAHFLPGAPEGHKCRRLHGHSFRVRVTIRGNPDRTAGWVMDFGTIKERFEPIRRQLDHYCLNEIIGLENPTSERIAEWIWPRLKAVLPELAEIEIFETCTTGCRYRGA
jgi:6-pyruvoyltetrahydropterin/6-carboxytetrahydropterin synthase